MAGAAIKSARKTSVGIAYYAVAGGIAFIGAAFLGFSLFEFALPILGTMTASVMTGAVFLFLSGMVGVAGHYAMKGKKPLKKGFSEESFIDGVEKTIKSMMETIEDPVRENPAIAVLLAAVAGYAAGDSVGEKIH
jgi:hypothetical protein